MGKHRQLSPGDRFADLELVEDLGLRLYGSRNVRHWRCWCLLCGGEVIVPQKNLGTAQKDCGCRKRLPRKLIPPGTRFGRLVVLESIPSERGLRYRLRCDCGNETTATRANLISAYVQSCGCLHDEEFLKKSREYRKADMVDGTTISHMAHLDTISKNNTSGVRGVSWSKARNKWYARMAYKGKTYSLGYHEDLSEAAAAVKKMRQMIREDFEETLEQRKNSET